MLHFRNMRAMCEESKDVGMATMSALNNQGESIERWEDVADGINEVSKIYLYYWFIKCFVRKSILGTFKDKSYKRAHNKFWNK